MFAIVMSRAGKAMQPALLSIPPMDIRVELSRIIIKLTLLTGLRQQLKFC